MLCAKADQNHPRQTRLIDGFPSGSRLLCTLAGRIPKERRDIAAIAIARRNAGAAGRSRRQCNGRAAGSRG